MGEHSGVVPRDDRAWPRWAAPFSVVLVVAAVVVAAGAVATASEGAVPGAGVAAAFVVGLGVGSWTFRGAFRRMLAGASPAAGSWLPQLGLVVLGFVATGYDVRLGLGLWGGLFAAMFGTNLWAIRKGRGNRDAVDAADAVRDRTAAAVPPAGDSSSEGDGGDGGPPVDVAVALDGAWKGSRRRWLALLIATALVTVGTAALTDSGLAQFMVPFMGGVFLLWATLSVLSTWRARRDFAAAKSEPGRAYVVLLSDPAPRMVRPLLGVWSEAPVPRQGRFPKPELVFRCDDEVDDLLSHQGSAVVHEAWVDTSSRGMRGARWVAADAGIAVPHHRGLLFGRWYLHALTRAERPGPPLPLRSPMPHGPRSPRPPVPYTEVGGPGPWALARGVGWRTAALAALAVVCVLIDGVDTR